MSGNRKKVQDLQLGDEEKDSVISHLQSEISELKTTQDTSQDKLNEGVTKVEEQLNIPITENSEDQNLDLFDRILRVGSNVKSLHDQINDQIVDILERGFQDAKFLQDTLYNIKEKLGGSVNIPTDDVEVQEALQNIRKIAFDKEPEPKQLQKALQESIMIHQDSETKIKYQQKRISDLEQQINFYIESSQNPGVEPSYDFNQDFETASAYSSFQFSGNTSPRRYSSSRNDASSFRSQRYHKPHTSINPDSQEMDSYALNNSVRQQVATEYSDKISQLSAKLSDVESKNAISNQEHKILNQKFSNLQKKYKELESKYKKLLSAQANPASPRSDKIDNLTEQVKKLQAELASSKASNETQAKQLNDTKVLATKYKTAFANLKKKYEHLQQEETNLKKQISQSTDRNVVLDVSFDEKVEKTGDSNQTVQYTLDDLKKQNQKQKEYLLNIRKALGLPIDDLEPSNQGDNNENSDDFFNKDILAQVSKINKEVENSNGELNMIKKELGISSIPSADKEGEQEDNSENSVKEKILKYQKENEELKAKLQNVQESIGLTGNDEETKAKLEEISRSRQKLQQLVSAIRGGDEPANIDDLTEEEMNQIIKEAKQDKEITESVKSLLPEGSNETSMEETKAKLEEATKARQQLQQLISAVRGSNEPIDPENLTEEELNQIIKEAKQDKEITESVKSILPEGSNETSLEETKAKLEEATKARQQLQQLISAVRGGDEPANLDNLTEEEMIKIINEAKQDKEITDSVKSTLPEGSNPEETKTKLEEATKARQQLQQLISAIRGGDEPANIDNMTEEDLNQIIKEAKQDKEITESVKSILPEGSNESSLEETKAKLEEATKARQQLQQLISAVRGGDEPANLDNLTEEELTKIINEAKQDKEITESVKSILPEGSNESSLEETKAKLEEATKARQQLQQLISAVRGNEEPINLDNLTEEDLNQIIKEAKQDKEITESVKSILPEGSNESSLEETKAKLEEATKARQQLQQLISAVRGNEEPINLDNLTEDEMTKIINEAKQDKEVTDSIKSSLSDQTEEGQNGSKPQSLIDQINEANKEKEKIKQTLDEIAKSLGIKREKGSESDDQSAPLTAEELCAAIVKAVDEQKAENDEFKEAIGEEIGTEGKDGETSPRQKDAKTALKKQKEENEILKKHLQEVLKTLGLPGLEENEDGSLSIPKDINLETECNKISTEIKRIQTKKSELETNMRSLKESLGLEEEEPNETNETDQTKEGTINKKRNLSEIIQDTNKENKELKEQLKNMKEILGIKDENEEEGGEEGKSGDKLISHINEVNEENKILKSQVQEMCKMLGIPDITEQNQEGGEGSSAESQLSPAQRIENATNEIKNKVEKLQEENKRMKEQLVTMAESVGLDSSILKEENMTPEKLEEQCNEIKTRINKFNQENNTLRSQNDEIRRSIGLPPLTDEELEETIKQTNTDSNPDNKTNSLLNKLEELKKNDETLKTALGLDSTTSSTESIQTKTEQLKKENERLRQQNNKLRETLGLPPLEETTTSSGELNTEEGAENANPEDETETMISTIQKQKEENEILKKHLQEVLKTLGLPGLEENEDGSLSIPKDINLETECNKISTEIKRIQTKKSELESNMRSLKESLGLEEEEPNERNETDQTKEGTINKKRNLSEIIQDTNKENKELKEQLKNMKEILGIKDENEEGKSEDQFITRINEVNEENKILKSQVQEMCKMLGIPDITEETGEAGGEEGKSTSQLSPAQRIENATNEIKNKVEKLQEENKRMKEQLVTMAESVGLDSSILKEENMTPEKLEEQCNEIKTRINKFNQENNTLRSQNDEIRRSIGLPPLTDEELEETIKQTNTDSNPDNKTNSLLNKLEELKKNDETLKTALGLDSTTSSTESIQTKTEQLKKENERLRQQNNKLRETLGLPPLEETTTNNESSGELGTENANPEDETETMVSTIQKQREENEILKKHLQEVLKTLGLPGFEENEDGSLSIPKDINLETECNKISTEIKRIQTKKSELETNMRSLKESLGLEEEEPNETNEKTGSESPRDKKKKNLSEIIQDTNKENKELKEQLKNMKELLGLPTDEETEEGTSVNEVTNSLQKQKELFNQLLDIFQDSKLDDQPPKTNEEIVQRVKDLQNTVKVCKFSNKIKDYEYDEIASLLFNEEFSEDDNESGDDEGKSNPESKIVRAIKYLKKRKEQLEEELSKSSTRSEQVDELSQKMEKIEQENKDLENKLTEKEKEFNKMKQSLIETKSKNSGIIEERSAFHKNIMQSLQDALAEAVKSPEGKESPIYIKLNDISQEILNQQSMIGELANDKEKFTRLDKLEDERSQILDSLQLEGLLTSKERKDAELVPLIQTLINNLKKDGKITLDRSINLNQNENDSDPINKLLEENQQLKSQISYLQKEFNIPESAIKAAKEASSSSSSSKNKPKINKKSLKSFFENSSNQKEELPKTTEEILNKLGIDSSELTPEEKQQIIAQIIANAQLNEQEIREILDLPPGNSIIPQTENINMKEEDQEARNDLIKAVSSTKKQKDLMSKGTITLCKTLGLLPTEEKINKKQETEEETQKDSSQQEVDQKLMNNLVNKVSSMSREAVILKSEIASLQGILGIQNQEGATAQDLIEEVANKITELNKEKVQAQAELEEIQNAFGITKSDKENPDNEKQKQHSFIQEISNTKKENEILKSTLNKLRQKMGLPPIEEVLQNQEKGENNKDENKLIEEECSNLLKQMNIEDSDTLNDKKIRNQNDIYDELLEAFEPEGNEKLNPDEKQSTKENIINKVKAQSAAFNKLRSILSNNDLENKDDDEKIDIENMTEEELAERIAQIISEAKELENKLSIQNVELSRYAKEEEKKNKAIHKLSMILDPFIQYTDEASSELIESEASLSGSDEEELNTRNDKFGSSRGNNAHNRYKQQEDRTLDDIVIMVSNLTEQVRHLLQENSNLSLEMENNQSQISNLSNSIKVTDVSTAAYTEEREILASLLLAAKQNDSGDSDDFAASEEEDLGNGQMKLVSALKKLQRHQNKLENKANKANEEKVRLEKELQLEQKNNEASKDEISKLKEKINQLEKENKDRQLLMNTIIEERKEFEMKLQDIVQNNSELSSPVVNQLMTLSNELSKQQQLFHQQYNSLETKTINKLEEENQVLKNQLKGITNNDFIPINERNIDLSVDSNGNPINPEINNNNEELVNKKENLEKEKSKLKQENEKLQKEIEELEKEIEKIKSEKETNQKRKQNLNKEKDEIILNSIKPKKFKKITKHVKRINENGIEEDYTIEEEEEEGEIYDDESEEPKEESPIYKQVQQLKQEVAERCQEISQLKSLLDNSKDCIERLQREQNETLRALYGEIGNNDEINYLSPADQTELIENLDELGSQIGIGNESLNQAIKHGDSSAGGMSIEEIREKMAARQRKSQKEPIKKPQNAILESLKKMQNELKEQAANNAEKDSKIEELETKINELEKERKIIMRILELAENNDDDQNKEEEDEEELISSPIYWKIHSMKEKADSLQSEVENLQKQLNQMNQTIQQLNAERQTIMQALYGGDEEDDLNNSELIDNLNSLNNSINQQSKKINAAIIEEPSSPRVSSPLSSPLSSPSRRNRMQRPQNKVLEALRKIRSDLNAATKSNCDKDIRIEELENQLCEFQEGNVTTRSVHINQNNNNNNNAEIGEVEKRIADLEQQILQLQSEKKSADEQINALSNETRKLKELNQNIDKLEKLIERLQDEKNSSERQANILQEENSKLRQKIKEIQDPSSIITNNSSEQEEKIKKLQDECNTLKFEKNAVMAVLGLQSEEENKNNSSSEELITKSNSPIFNQIQSMTKTVEDQLQQIEKLKNELITAAETIQQLTEERNSIMQALMPDEDLKSSISASSSQADLASRALFKNLESLGLQISKQNEDMNSAIDENATLDVSPDSSMINSQITRSPRRERQQRPQNLVVEALNNIRSQLAKAQEEVSEKEIKIAELERKIETLQNE